MFGKPTHTRNLATAPWAKALFAVALLALLLPPFHTDAQANQATLVGRAVLPAAYLTDGPAAGFAIAPNGAIVNGVKVPFDSQPVGAISAIVPGQYAGTWIAISSGQFDKPENSADYLLRFYVLELDFLTADGGTGEVNILDRFAMGDPLGKQAEIIINNDTRSRNFSGADLVPRAVARFGSTLWVAEAQGPSLLRFDGYGKLQEAPIVLPDGVLQGMNITLDRSALIIAQRDPKMPGRIIFRSLDLRSRALSLLPIDYRTERNSYQVGGLVMVNAQQALLVEFDTQQHSRASFKRIYQIDITAEDGQKTELVDLMGISDPEALSTSPAIEHVRGAYGVGELFKFPYSTITTLYPLDPQTLVVANNNRLPFGLGRSRTQADSTEFIAIRLPQSLDLDPKFAQSR
jgi:glycerophosphoryl diester phosphodiesterase